MPIIFGPMGVAPDRLRHPLTGGPIMGVGISGKIATGKSTLAMEIMKHTKPGTLARPSRKLALADELKLVVGKMLYPLAHQQVGFPKDEIVLGWVQKNKHRLRGTLQDIGLLMREEAGESYWVDKMLSKVYNGGKWRPGGFIGVVDDVRFRSEFTALREAGFLMVRLEVPKLQTWFEHPVYVQRRDTLYPNLPHTQLEHQSEVDLDDYADDGHGATCFDISLDCTLPSRDVFKSYYSQAQRYKWA